MGKKGDKNIKDKGQNSAHHIEEDGDRTPEPHVCTGHFQTDFTELCRRNNMAVIPPVVPRAHRPPSPGPPEAQSKNEKGKGKEDKNKQPEPDPESVLEPVEPTPKSYTTKSKFEYFKPTVQVEQDHPDKQDTVTEVIVKGWKIDEAMMTVFKQCFVSMEKLHTINFWNCGLTGETLSLLASFLPQCLNTRNLILDGNPVKEENFHLLINTEEIPVQNLSLRHCSITDLGAENLGKALGTTQTANTKLLTLNLNGNRIGDTGGQALAKGLRMNRTLLSLSLAQNSIGDVGIRSLADVLSKFPLTHEEVVQRRKLISEQGAPDRKSPPPSRRGDNRPGSVRSSSHLGKDAKRDKTPKGKHTKGKEEKDDKKGKKEVPKKDSFTRSKATLVAEATKTATKAKDKKGKDKKGAQQVEAEPENMELMNPLMEPVENIKNELWIPGNRTLINLNLRGNKMTEKGLADLLMALQYQTTLVAFNKGAGTGLMRIAVDRNEFPVDCAACQKLVELMIPKDPFYVAPSSSPENESQADEDPPKKDAAADKKKK